MAERRAGTKSRRLGSSRRKQLREGSGEAPATAPSPGEEPPCPPEIVQRVQDFFRERDEGQEVFVTRSDMQKLREEGFPCSTEELELVFDGLDAASTGRLSTEEFTAGLWQFLSSQKASRDHRRRKTASRRVRLVIPSPVLEGAESEERRHFAAFMEQLGTDNVSEEQEIWQLWVKLRQDEPQLLGNLEDFLAKMRHLVQETKSKKEALEVTLNKRVAEHDKEVQQLCEALKQQIQQEREQMEQEGTARSQQCSAELQRELDAGEREVQRLVRAQMELETRCRSLLSTQQVTSTENQQLEDHLQHLQQQLQQTHRHLQTARVVVAWEHTEESRDGAVTELPSEALVSPQMSPEKSEKNDSEMWIRLGSQSNEPKTKSTHQVVWEVLPAGTSPSGALQRVSSTEEDPFPEFLKEEPFSDQSSLLREMNDAIAALSKQLKPQVLKAPPTPADTAHHPQDDAESQMGPEAATAPGTSLEVPRETILGHVDHELLEGDQKEGPVTDELCTPDMPQDGGSMGARHSRVQELGSEQGESPEEARRMFFLQGTGAGVKELMLKVAEDLQGAPGESTEAGEQVLVEAEGWTQEKTGWEEAQLPGEAEKVASSQGENLAAGLGPPEAGQAGQGAGQQLALDEPMQPRGVGLGEEADPPSGLSEELEIKSGERPEPEPPPWAEVRTGAAQTVDVLPEVPAAAGRGLPEEEHVGAEVQPRGDTLDTNVPPAQHGGSSRAEEGGMEVMQPGKAERHGESARGDGAAWAGPTAAEGLLLAPWAVPPADGQERGVGADVQPLEAQSSSANLQLLPEMEVALQPLSEAGSPGTEQGGSVAPDVQPLEEDDKPELGLGEETGAAAVQGEGPSPGSPGLGEPIPVKAQALEMEAADVQVDTELGGGLSPEGPQGGEGVAAVELEEEAEDGAQGQDECELLNKPVLDPQGAGFGQGDGAGAGAQAPEEAEILDTLQDQSTDANVLLLAETDEPLSEVEELKLTPGESTETHLRLSSEASSLDMMQRETVAPDVQPLEQVNKPELVELEAEGSWADTQLRGAASPENPQGEGDCAAVQLGEGAEDGAQGQDERELLQELALEGAGFGQGDGAGGGVQPQEEAENLDTLQDQSTDANVQPLAEADELKVTPGRSREADLQLSSEDSSLDTEQGGSVAPAVQLLDQVNQLELVELEAGGSWADRQLCGVANPETPWGGDSEAAGQLREETEDGSQGQDERELLQEPVLDLEGTGFGQGEGAGAGAQLHEEAETLDTLQDQSADANMLLLAETDEPLSELEELKLIPGGTTETDLKLLCEDTKQRESITPDVQPLDQVNQPELVELEAEGSWADMQLRGVASPETPQGQENGAVMQLEEEAEDKAQGQDEHELLNKPVLDPQGAGFGQGDMAGAEIQPPEEAEILDMLQDQSTDANVLLLAETDQLKLTPEQSKEVDLKLSSEGISLDTEEARSVSPDVQLLDQVNEPELVEMVEAGGSWADTWLCEDSSLELSQGEGDCAAGQLREEAEDGAQGQDERELLQEPVLDLEGARFGQGDGAGAGAQLHEETKILDMLQDQSAETNMLLLAETDELKVTPGGSREADLAPLGGTGMQKGEQSQAQGSEAVLCAAHTSDTWEGGAGTRVSIPAEATLRLELATATESPGPEAKLGVLTGLAGQILEDTQTLETAQQEGLAAEESPLVGAQGLEGVWGERLEAGVRSLVESQSPGMKQGQDDGVSVLASPVSEVTLQTSTLKLETMMQEDVLVPDVRRIGASGQAAQSQLQEQVSAQADKMRLHTASQQPEKPPHVMEAEQVAARPAEHPKQEVPAASTLHTSVQQEEDAGNDLLGMVLRDSSLGHAANRSMQPHRQLLGEQSEALNVGQQQKQQEVGEKTSQECEPSRGEPGAVTTAGIGAAPRDSPEASLEPDHLYNVLFVGDSHVGKTSFLYRLHTDTFNPHITATLGLDYQTKNLVVDNKRFVLRLWDSAGQERYHSITKQFFRKADGVVLMYDITSHYSFLDVRYWLSCIQEGAEDGVTVLLLGNKSDLAEERQVPTMDGECLAKEHQIMFYECSAASGHNVSESMASLVRLLKVHEGGLKTKAEEVPKPPQKKKGCC